MTPARTSPPTDVPQLGLRERKKIKTRTAIRDATYALIQEQGYDATTIEQIADRAEVSPSTVFRYFPTKEDIVLTDEHDALILEELKARPKDEPWTDSVRHIMHKAVRLGHDREPEITRIRAQLMVEVPTVRARMMESMSVASHMLAEGLAERTGRDVNSLEVRVYTMSVVAGLAEISRYWAENDFREDLADLLDRALDVLANGLTTKNT
ncbi:TetR family transcriptional regulator [Streptomyces sp. Act143]|uniref:TetR/AcrR family transcriptional regulator n=1 Tax=Streptomyces sp. Act143 TaxID=2200760 RepID=UPI000D6801BA|nr:TetR family transcriptional regulator [Streptomyces sp. Act143]PWI20722.1 TetR family transcriptional regulator [Streptomyces sp. Act143]